jgi:hypothetical protein
MEAALIWKPNFVVIPWPATSHITPIVDVGCLLAAHGAPVTIITTPASVQLVKGRVNRASRGSAGVTVTIIPHSQPLSPGCLMAARGWIISYLPTSSQTSLTPPRGSARPWRNTADSWRRAGRVASSPEYATSGHTAWLVTLACPALSSTDSARSPCCAASTCTPTGRTSLLRRRWTTASTFRSCRLTSASSR